MAFTPEDGTGLAAANAYIDVAFFKSYHSDRGTIITSGAGDIQSAVVRATDFMQARWLFVGVKKEKTQALHWPAIDAYYRDGRLVDSTTVPVEVKQACAEYAKRELDSPGGLTADPSYDDTNVGVTKRVDKVGPIVEEREFGGSGIPKAWRKYPKPDGLLSRSGLVVSGNRLLRS